MTKLQLLLMVLGLFVGWGVGVIMGARALAKAIREGDVITIKGKIYRAVNDNAE